MSKGLWPGKGEHVNTIRETAVVVPYAGPDALQERTRHSLASPMVQERTWRR